MYENLPIGSIIWLNENDVRIKDYQQLCKAQQTKCYICGAPIIRKISDIKRNGGVVFCGHECQFDNRLKHKDPLGYAILDKQHLPEFYYLLGLIATDGYIEVPQCNKHACSYFCSISLHLQDIQTLLDIQKIFGGVVKQRNKTIVEWRIYNRHFVKFLYDIGITHKKSLTLCIHDWFHTLTNIQQDNFMYGVFDGDGCIYEYRYNNTSYYQLSVCSASKKFINSIEHWLLNRGIKIKKTSSLPHSKFKSTNIVDYLHINGRNICKLLSFIKEKDASKIFILRKRLILDKCLSRLYHH